MSTLLNVLFSRMNTGGYENIYKQNLLRGIMSY